MTKAEVVKSLKEKAGLATLAQAEAAYDSLFGIIKAALKKGDALAITGFGRVSGKYETMPWKIIKPSIIT
ncbi:MAG: HU family DNA-binding protein [Desulfovibrionaceae bacterium]|nr:HU family DNA-binding protein [Desulfovibrionaceae bacterium]MCL2123232.1 HU family DNA-binding protein [Desulfovibrionaceae bacterium]